jgi:hypothetical protein
MGNRKSKPAYVVRQDENGEWQVFIKQANGKVRPARPKELPCCPTCGGPLDNQDLPDLAALTAVRMCGKCRSSEMAKAEDSLWGVSQLLAMKEPVPAYLKWTEICAYGRKSCGGDSFDEDPIRDLRDWLIVTHNKNEREAWFTPCSELLAMLKAAEGRKAATGAGGMKAGETREPAAEKPALPVSNHAPITVDEANATAMKLAKQDAGFVNKTIRQWAKEIRKATGKTCSPSTVKGTALWTATMKRTGRGRTRGKAAKVVSMTDNMAAVIGRGAKHQVLQDLIAQQETEQEADDTMAREAQRYKRV